MTQLGERFIYGEFYKQIKRLHFVTPTVCYGTVSSYLSLTCCKGKTRGNRMQLLLLQYSMTVLERRPRKQASIWTMFWCESACLSFGSKREWSCSVTGHFIKCPIHGSYTNMAPSAWLENIFLRLMRLQGWDLVMPHILQCVLVPKVQMCGIPPALAVQSCSVLWKNIFPGIVKKY